MKANSWADDPELSDIPGRSNGPEPTEILVANKAVEGYSMAPDALIQRYGYQVALVWGKLYRYCQMKDGNCSRSKPKMAAELRMKVDTVRAHIELLVRDGYYSEEIRPGQTSIYRDTGRLRMIEGQGLALLYPDLKTLTPPV